MEAITKKKKLNLEERVRISKLIGFGYSDRLIGKALSRDRTTIYRERKRLKESIHLGYDYILQGHCIHESVHLCRVKASTKGKMHKMSLAVRRYIEYFIKHKLSPEIICGRLELISKGEVKISYETIYQWILTERPDLYEYLIKAGKPRRRRVPGKRKRSFKQPAAPKTSIELRPQEVEQRERLGDLEHDSMVSRKSNVAIQNIVDRASRKVFLQKLEDQSANTYSNALITRMKEEFPLGILKTATSDNGKENANHHIIDSTLKISSFFAHPYCSSERGTVENRNGIARWLGLPKGCDFSLISLEQLKTIEDRINRRPLKCLQFKTPNEKFKELLALELQAQTLSA